MTRLTVDAADRLLAAWDERLRRVDDNLLALEGDATYRLCEGRLGKLDGRTREVLAPVLAEIPRLFSDREQLGAVIDRARAVRASMSALSFWDNDERAEEMQALLLGPSVVHEFGPAPLARRSLLDDPVRETRATPDEVLARMSSAFDRVRDVLATVGLAWDKLGPSIDEARVRAQRLSGEARGAGLDGEVDAVAAALAAAEVRMARDPLAASDDFREQIATRLQELERRLHEHRQVAIGARAALAEAGALLAELKAAHGEAREALRHLETELVLGAGAQHLAADEAAVRELGEWLARLESAFADGHAAPVAVGVTRFRERAQACRDRDRAALARVVALRAKRDELIGRTQARRAQLAAMLAKGARLRADVSALAAEAARLTQQRPMPLADAVVAVEAFEAALRG